METKYWKVITNSDRPESLAGHSAIREAAALLKEGGIVAFPTETVYGLGADASSSGAVTSVFRAKGRPSDNPLIVHIADLDRLERWTREVPEKGVELARRYWPGPLTLILPHRGNLAPQVTAGLSTVGIRIPSHPVALALLRESGLPVAAPSANRSGKPSPTDAAHVRDDLHGRIDGILDGGTTGIGVESTVVDVTSDPPVLLRPGGITLDMLRDAVGEIRLDRGLERETMNPRSPGMKYRHYAPQGKMWVVTGEGKSLVERVQRMADGLKREGMKVGILSTEEHAANYEADWVFVCGRRSDPFSIARGLYQALRAFDEVKAEAIVAEGFPPQGVLFTVMNRLVKAAEGRVISAGES
ncbi:translation factor SUA5 [Melghirimyces profundicolus]|uniref:Threonylcarbamoyl-AMP synthase n=1 Tax=Melghirimyces profundicolus TaxID=1242148 RepID=A0A2T6C2E4_9BACL|nr:L-threonylcarbamoyladenylate synthase [Melghirimyces profundicolus]PTX62501.1 translation factor SUA5 [Melghirimyces profundicolus]